MATEALAAEVRTQTGTSHSRRLRLEGKVPTNLYGLGKDPVALTLASDAITPAIVAGQRVIDVDVDGTAEKAMIREVQWDTFLTHILHADFQRVDPNARVDVDIPVVIRGVVNEGVLDHVLHEISVDCPVYKIPEKAEVRVGALKIGDEVTIADLAFDGDLTSVLPSETVVLRVTEAQEVEIVQEDVGAAAEPEVIGQKADDEEAGE